MNIIFKLTRLVIPAVIVAFLLGGCPQPIEEKVPIDQGTPGDATAPELAAPGSQLSIDSINKTLTVAFSEAVKITDSGQIQVFKKGIQLEGGQIKSIKRKPGDAAKIVITLTDTIAGTDEFHVIVKRGAIADKNGNKPAQDLETEKESISKDTTAPALAAPGSQLDVNNVKKTLTVTFSEPVKITDPTQIKTQIEVHKDGSKLAAGQIAGIPLKPGDAAKIVITLADAFQEQDRFKVVIPVEAIADLNGNKPAGALTTEIKSADTTPPVLKGAAGNYLVVNTAAETLTVTFSEAITIKDAALIAVKKNGINLTGDEVAGKVANKATIVITLRDAPEAADSWQVVFNAGAVEDLGGSLNDKLETEVELEAPGLAEGGDALTVLTGTRTLEIAFSKPLKAIAAKALNLTVVNKTPSGGTKTALAADKISSIGLKPGDNTRVQIVLADAMAGGDKYQVDFLENAATGTGDSKNPIKLSTETDTLGIVDNTPPALATGGSALSPVSYLIHNFGLGLSVDFGETISRFDASKIEVHRDGVELGAEDDPKTRDVDEDAIETMYLSDVDQLIIVLKKAAGIHGRYQVRFQANAVFDAAGNGNTSRLSTETDTLNFMIKSMAVDATAKTLTLGFSKAIANAGGTRGYSVYRNSDNAVYPDKAAVVGSDVVLTLKDAVRETDLFRVYISANAVTATGGVRNNMVFETGRVSQAPVTDATAPELKSSGNIFIKQVAASLILYLTFNEPLSAAHKSSSSNVVVRRDGVALPRTDIQSFFKPYERQLGIVLKPAASLHGRYSVKVSAGLVQDAAGNANAVGTSETSAVHFVFTGYALDTAANTLTLRFSKPITRIPGDVADFNLYRDGVLHAFLSKTKTVTLNKGNLVIGRITVESGNSFRMFVAEGRFEAGAGNKNVQMGTGGMVAP